MSEFATSGGHCRNGRCTRPIYRGRVCFRCWAGVKWTSVNQRIANKNGNNPSYRNLPIGFDRKSFVQWVLDNPPSSGMHIPSIDRIRPEAGYTPGNIQWIERNKNSAGVNRDLPDGSHRCSRCKAVMSASVANFVIDKRRQHGLGCYCRNCNRAKWREHYV